MGLANRLLLLWLTTCSLTLASHAFAHEHVVQPGQTLAKIAKRYRVELGTLCEANNLKKASKLQPGLRLTIPSDSDRVDSPLPKSSASANADVRGSATKKAEPARHSGTPTTSYGQYLSRPTKRGWVHIMGHHGDWQGQLLGKSGKLQPKAVAALSRLLAWPRTDFSMDRRLLILLGQVSDAFGGRTLRVVSGYRTTSYAAESKHPLGRACDFHVLGVPNTALRDFVRTFDNVGVGYYPNSTFIHLDSRDHDAFWIDYAGPGEPPRSTPHRIARASDAPSLTAERAAAVMKDSETSDINPEAAADAEPLQSEGREAKPDAPISPVASPPKRVVGTPPQRNTTRPNTLAEPEATVDVQRDANAHQVDL